MPTLIIETKINKPPEVCFNLIRRAGAETGNQKINGEFAKGQTVTFQNSFLGFRQNLTVKIIRFEKPKIFVDEMTAGNFKSFRHVHDFILQDDDQTILKDIFEWASPFGIFGRIIDELFIKNRLRKIVVRRNQRLKEIAEQGVNFKRKRF